MTGEQGFKYISAGISGLAASFWSLYGAVFVCVLVAIILDVVTGLIKAKATGTPLSSEKGTRGFWKKLALLAALAFGIFLDAFIPIMLGVVSLELPFTLPIGTVVGCYIVVNEAISIFENINEAAPTALPRWIRKLLEGSKNTINNGGEKDDESSGSKDVPGERAG